MSYFEHPSRIEGYASPYTGLVTVPGIALQTDLGLLMQQLNPEYDGSPVPEELIKTYIDHDDRDLIVAVRGEPGAERVVGTASLGYIHELFGDLHGGGPIAFLGSMVVSKEVRGIRDPDGLTIARKILDVCGIQARARGASEDLLAVDPNNQAAVRSYANVGFSDTGAMLMGRKP